MRERFDRENISIEILIDLHNFRTPEYKMSVFRMPSVPPPVFIFLSLTSEQLDALFIFDIQQFVLHRSVPCVFELNT
jgi:hypothetical protein